MREFTIKLPQRKGTYEEALEEAIGSEDVFGETAAILFELLEAVRGAA